VNRIRAGLVVMATAAALTVAPAGSVGSVARAQECGSSFPVHDRDVVATGSSVLPDVAIPMSDGVVLRARVTLPAGVPGPFPTALTITGYNKSGTLGASDGDLVRHGYATVVLDDRGTGTSQGMWDSWGARTRADYVEVLDWIVAQPWSDGRIGATGTSYMGITSLYAAATGHGAVKAVFAIVPMADGYRDIVQAGGQTNTAFIPFWLALVTGLSLTSGAPADVFVDHLLGVSQFQVPMLASAAVGGEPAYDGPFWRQRSPIEVIDDIRVPTFVVGGLDDIFQRGEPMLYERLADHTDARLLIGPWTHISTGSGLPRDGVPAVDDLLLQWFDQHVLGLDTGASCVPQVTQFVRGHERYESSPTWPVPDLVARRWHLRSGGRLTTEAPTGAEDAGGYTQLPITGICTRSTAQWLIGLTSSTPCATDNRFDEALSLTFTSEPFATEQVINGPIEADIWITATSDDAAVSVAVSDVAPDGTSLGLTNGLLLASHRAVDPARSRLLDGQSIQPWHPFTAAARLPVVAGEPMLVPIEVFPTSAAIAPGHRLRVTIAPYDVPHALPAVPALLDTLAGTVTVLSGPDHPSSIVVPLVDASPARSAALGAGGGAGAPATDDAAARHVEVAAGGGDATATTRGLESLPRTGRGHEVGMVLLVLGFAVVLRTRMRSGERSSARPVSR
jgi:putative CocE/NonD family hydrolase